MNALFSVCSSAAFWRRYNSRGSEGLNALRFLSPSSDGGLPSALKITLDDRNCSGTRWVGGFDDTTEFNSGLLSALRLEGLRV